MKPNLSNLDRSIRVVVAVLFAYLYFGGIVTGALGIVLVVLGAVFVLSAIVGYCPLYTIFKFSTLKS
jgi:K+-transporting ATPase A subunit